MFALLRLRGIHALAPEMEHAKTSCSIIAISGAFRSQFVNKAARFIINALTVATCVHTRTRTHTRAHTHTHIHTRTHTHTCTHAKNAQLTRERIDSLSDVMRTLAIARQKHSERMDQLERHVRTNEDDTNKRLDALEVASKRKFELVLCKGDCLYTIIQQVHHQSKRENLGRRPFYPTC